MSEGTISRFRAIATAYNAAHEPIKTAEARHDYFKTAGVMAVQMVSEILGWDDWESIEVVIKRDR